ncbi:putative flagellar hook-associated protein 1 FlgK-like [Herminiimonas arsenicoxydans]|uniref:Flagellar hook-associated protein 1 n=1 Tax=Herminiimonas arsenicoxydans TaxID=204773 RepID=A4G6A5_HERAR|nr:putative flagellar hook-associated protein 1 FlgK-like [Herminiimonas arsenicoxydans]
MSNLLSIAKSGLAAAHAGIATTGHNIANQATPGYSRQLVIQASLGGQNIGGGYIGNGTNVETVRRIYNDFLGAQVVSAQSSKSQLDTYYMQINKVNNMLADPSVGLSPVIADFFKGIQDLVANPGIAPSRQAMLSGAEALVARFQSLDGQLTGMRNGVNSEIAGAVTNINAYAKQIGQLNDAISKAQNGSGQPPNDLLDQRDLLIGELAKQSKVTLVQQDGNYNVFIGNGQPLVVGLSTYELTAVPSSTDPGRMQVGYIANGKTVILPESSLTGGNLGGLFEYRSKTLDPIQNSLGRIALGLASTFNEQHRLGQDQNGKFGGDFFNMATPQISSSKENTGNAKIDATINSVDKLTTSDYRLSYDGSNYTVTRLSDNVAISASNMDFPATPIEMDGISFSMDTSVGAGTMAAGDEFIIKPTINGASGLSVLIKDIKQIAAGTPIRTNAPIANTGTGAISAGTINAGFDAVTAAALPVDLIYDAAANTFSGFPAGMDVTVNVGGTKTVYPAALPPAETTVPYTAGAIVSFGGAEIKISGTPADGDTFSISANTNGDGDNRNMLLLGELQTKNVLQGGTASYNSAYSQLVSQVGNKTRELETNSLAEGALLKQMQTAQQSESGVNLDEEATNLLRYQQAYQASGKVMQAVSDMFDVLISLGR